MTLRQPFRVWVTRPKPQGEVLCQHLQAQGYETVFLPVIEIKALSDTSLLREQIAQLGHYAWAIFISRSAVATSAALIHQEWPQLPAQLKVAAVGEGTAEALKQANLPVTIYPPVQWSSEGLLALPEFQDLTEKKLAIFCGQGGRELLATTLQQRGAEVTRFVSYQRVLPELDLKPYLDLLRHKQVDALVSTSVDSLTNLKKLFAGTEWQNLKKIPLVLISERIMIQAKELGFESCFLAKAASHEGISQALNRIRNEAMTSQEKKPQETKSPEEKISADSSPRNALEKGSAKTGSSGKTAVFFLTILTLALMGGAGAIYYRTYLLSQTVNDSLLNFSHQTKWDQHQISDLQNEITVLQQRLQQQEETLRKQTQVLQDWHGLSQVGPSSRGRDHSSILDAQYFVKLANDQLLLTNDLPQTLNFLNQAQTELNKVVDPQAESLKKAVAQDIAALKNLPAPSLTNVYLSLSSLKHQLEKLPLLVVPVQNSEASAPPAAPATLSLWEKGLQRIGTILRQMVVVYHLPTPKTPPFITPDQRPYIYESLQSTLSDAGWAVLHHDSEIYHSNLQQAAEWIRQYFSINSPLTQAVLTELQALQAVSIQPAKEVVLGSPKVFQDYLKTEPAAASSVSG